ncbi:RagB/SusD family nutrient uptake outer membrane protein [Sphingobacterium hotanense]|uniref:RagB/SusD family nutrient uptake outer membrane protein n=1 Tax=Sphingobacterium hotanense TaxID=649196 RepID=UPI0021A4AEBA|nr:RagB/SusD family nutrient uptake outer membrane protein [Sphingobacterium hotanense]MCT1525146.1 RagB/SusD family nutrient uptake outer membrane protein [Sphingobacterium hotanense]
MKNINIKLIALLCTVFAIAFSSCSKWLDVTPEDNVYADDAFKDLKGFESGLAGVYNSMTASNLYGAELKYNFADALAGYWQISNSANSNYYASNYDFAEQGVQNRINNIWTELYKSIHQVNIMFDYLDNLKESKEKNLVKGELLGLRAFLHLEVFKWFGPVVREEGTASKAVPYYTTSTKKPQPFLTAAAFFVQAENDLLEAIDLLADDPINEIGRAGNGNSNTSSLNYSYLLNYRGARSNIYAVRAMLARMYELKGDNLKAGQTANLIITDLKSNPMIDIAWMTEKEINSALSDKDIRFSKENIFSIIKNESHTSNLPYFGTSRTLIPAYSGFLQNLYTKGSGASSDYRLIQWKISGAFSKFLNPDATSNKSVKRNELKLISLPELYFMVIEANLETDPELSVEMLNELRSKRGLSPVTFDNSSALQNIYIDEVRREFIGEGFLFTFYKRLYHSIYKSTGEVTPSLNIFKLPIPLDEEIFNKSN